MKRWAISIGIGLTNICVWAIFLREFVANHPIEYFCDRPQRLLFVAAIAVAGGAIVWAFSLPPQKARNGLGLAGKYFVALVVAYFAAWGVALIWFCRRVGEAANWSLFWSCLMLAWDSDMRNLANLLWTDGSHLIVRALYYSLLGFIPLAAIAIVFVRRMAGRNTPVGPENKCGTH